LQEFTRTCQIPFRRSSDTNAENPSGLGRISYHHRFENYTTIRHSSSRFDLISMISSAHSTFHFHSGVKADVSQAPEKTLINLILSDLRVFDPYEGARFRKVTTQPHFFSICKTSFRSQIVSQQGNDKELLRVDLCLFNYPDGYQKPLDVVDCDVNVQFAKANIVFLFKHIDAILVNTRRINLTNSIEISFICRIFSIH
jgi:hypothetical protein